MTFFSGYRRLEPIKLHIWVLLLSCGILLGSVLCFNRFMDIKMERFTEQQSRYHTICVVSLIISKNISLMQGNFQHMLLASSPADLQVAEEHIRESLHLVRRALLFLQKGGGFYENFHVNFENKDKVAHVFTLDKPPENTVLAGMELATSLARMEDMMVEYHQFAACQVQTCRPGGESDSGDLVLMHKKIAPFFSRMEEHANRFYVISMRSLEDAHQARNRERRQNEMALLGSSLFAVLTIVTIGIMVMRAASRILAERHDARESLLRVNELLEERITVRTAELARSENRLRDIALTSGDIIWQFDTNGYFVYVSGNIRPLLHLDETELLGMCFEDLRYPSREGSEALAGVSLKIQAREPLVDFVFPVQSRDDDQRMVSMLLNAIPLNGEDGFEGYFGTAKDISEKREYEMRLRLFEKLFDSSLEGMTITDADGTIVLVNPAFSTITGYASDEAIGCNPRILKSEHHPLEFYLAMWKSLEEEGLWTGEIWNRRKSGEAYPEWLSITAVMDESGAVQNYVGVFHDITAMKQKEEEILHMAYYDALTGLPNRTMLLERFGVVLMSNEKKRQDYGVLFVDLDNFKVINDSLGHEAGDELLIVVAKRFQRLVRSSDLVARLGGDEFVFLMELGDRCRVDLNSFAQRIIKALAEPVRIKGQDLFVTPSIGVAVYPDDGNTAEALLKHADLAMYAAKETGKNQCVQFTGTMIEKASFRLVLENQLRQALNRNEIYPVFQPKVSMKNGEVIGFEALARWAHDGKIVSPAEFIPVAEETGLIHELGETILLQSCRAVRLLMDTFQFAIKVAVNVSAKQFHKESFVDQVKRAVAQTDIPYGLLEFEITESLLLGDTESVSKKLALLEQLGITLSIDDFGTGYSSLSYLSRLPIQRIKIDRSFITGIHSQAGDGLSLLEAIIQMGKSLHMHVLAEGVETSEDVQLLLDLGCEEAQGFYYARPMGLDELQAYLGTVQLHGSCLPSQRPSQDRG